MMRSPSRRKVSFNPDSLRWPHAKQRWYVVSSLSLSGSCTAATSLSADLGETCTWTDARKRLRSCWKLHSRNASTRRSVNCSRPCPSRSPPVHPLSDPRPFRSVATSGQPFTAGVVIDGQTWEWFIRPLMGRGRAVEYFLTGLVASPATSFDADVGRLRETNAAKTEFLNMAAHELRTPLSVILGYGSMLAQGGLSPEHQKLAGGRIYEKARQLSRLIMDMSLVGRFDELGSSMAREPIDLVALVEPMVKDHQRRFGDLAIEFGFETPDARVNGNPYWLRLALRELMDNAVRFRPGPTGRIDINLTEAD